jgi:serine protease
LLVALQEARPARGGTSPARELLPDLDQETPFGLNVTSSGDGTARTYWLGFGSAVRNVGNGPLMIGGHRPDTANPAMTADQRIQRDDGSVEVVPAVGQMEFVTSPDHRHWHYLRFDRYQLRRAGSSRALVRDHKTGFCLGDRYPVTDLTLSHAVPGKVYRTNCGLNDTALLQVDEGISVGYGDDYKPFLEGQDLKLSGLPSGRYVLVHRVNADRRLRELSYGNDTASVLLDLRWHAGVPALRILRNCANSARCEKPLARKKGTKVLAFPARVAQAVARPADAFMPDDGGLNSQPGSWAGLQWNFDGPFGVDAPAAWANMISRGRPGGAGVTVAVLDTGIAYADQPPYRRSPELNADSFVPGYDFVDDDAYPLDLNGHGTHVASTIAESTNNGFGLTGLAYGVKLMPVRVLDAVGNGYPATIARGIRFAVNHGAKVLNLSFNFDPQIGPAQIPQVMQALAYAYKRGALVVVAAGNNGLGRLTYPALGPHVLSVGATTENGCLSSFSNHGPGLDLVAPGGGSDTPFPDDRDCLAGRAGRPIYQMTFRNGRISDFGPAEQYIGTSMATPHVSATAALVIASGVVGAHPKPLAVERRLERSARDLGAAGYDTRYGWGLVNASAATTRGTGPRPTRTILRRVVVRPGLATVDASRQFAIGGAADSRLARLAQLVRTVSGSSTRLPVQLLVAGRKVSGAFPGVPTTSPITYRYQRTPSMPVPQAPTPKGSVFNPALRNVQRRLIALHYLTAGGADGLWGPMTQEAVVAFQKWERLPRTSVLDARTRARLATSSSPIPVRRMVASRRIEILLDRQIALLIDRNRVVLAIAVSTGKPSTPTPPGHYSVHAKIPRWWSTPFRVWLPWAVPFVGGIALHEYLSVPTHAASHGCVRQVPAVARMTYNFARVGMPVDVIART